MFRQDAEMVYSLNRGNDGVGLGCMLIKPGLGFLATDSKGIMWFGIRECVDTMKYGLCQ